MSEQSAGDLAKQVEFDRLMMAAHVFRRRGDYRQAQEQVRKALELFPSSLDAQELAADILYARGQWQEAADAYKRILEKDRARVTVEEKYARVVLQLAEGERQKQLLQEMLENPESQQLPDRNPAVAAVLSGIPGLGHVYCGEYVKGAVLVAVVIVSWLIFFALLPNLNGLSLGQRISRFAQDMDPLAIAFLLVAVLVHLYAIVNAAVTADKSKSSPETQP